MDTLETAANYLQHNNTPYWWVTSGNSKIAECVSTDDLNTSIQKFRDSSVFWPAGAYKLECSDKVANRSGSFKLPFSKGQTTTQPTNMNVQPSNNVYGIPDAVLHKIQEETRQKILVEQMHADFTQFFKEWPEYKKLIDRHETFLKDDDSDGTPNFMEMAKKAGDTVKAGAEIKKVFSGSSGSLFG